MKEIQRIESKQKLKENSDYYMNKNQTRQRKFAVHMKNKSSTRDRIDFEKKKRHEVNVICDFMGNTFTYLIIKYAKWKPQKTVRIGLVLKMICGRNALIFMITCFSNKKDINAIISNYFMMLRRISIFFIYVYGSQQLLGLDGKDYVDVNLDVIYFEKEFDRCHIEVQKVLFTRFCRFSN